MVSHYIPHAYCLGFFKETVEKRTWFTSEKYMSQEGESEEQNSQKRTQPEKEEQEEAERMEILQKEDEKMMGEAIGDPAEKPSVTCASPKASPEVKTIKGEQDRPEWGRVSGGLIDTGTCAE